MNNKLDGFSMDLESDNKQKLQAVFPECFAEGKLDIDKLLSLCGEYIDEDFEKYKFEWKGKSQCLKVAQKRSRGTLRPKQAESVNFDTTENLYIEGDNLEVLKLLQTAYYRKVKMIYIDPPYNTGHDFVYEDDFAEPLANYKEVTSQATKSNPETMGRFHTNWLNMMYPRLRLAANLLSDDGVIFISIDDNEVNNLRKICDETFGEENFVAQFIISSNSTKNNAKLVSISHEYALCYAKNKDSLLIEWKVKKNNVDEYRTRATQLLKKGMNSEDIHKELLELVKYPRFYDLDHYTFADNKGIYQTDNPGGVSNGNTTTQIIHPITNKVCAMPSGGWRYKEAEIMRMIDKELIEFGVDETIIPRPKRYLDDYMYQIPKSVVFFDSQATTKWLKKNQIIFDFAKSNNLIQYFIECCTNENDTILDFFSGSATTAHAVMQLNAEDGGNRKFICVQLPELTDEKSEAHKNGYHNICEIGKERIRRAGKKILEETPQATLEERETPLDVGFKVLSLDTSNLQEWDSTPVSLDELPLLKERLGSMLDGIKDDRSDMDVVYEVMIKTGVTLDVPVTHMEVNGKLVYVVGDLLLMICLAKNVVLEDVEAMIEFPMGKLVIAEQSFGNDNSVMSNVYYLLKNKEVQLQLI